VLSHPQVRSQSLDGFIESRFGQIYSRTETGKIRKLEDQWQQTDWDVANATFGGVLIESDGLN
jgi:hypothetical protein